ncbi:hypothetical protein KEM55_004982 [Ascosphaera atra]|nr:hypothetical protein KEM55_004982 [Ascosphaera atra]
MSSLRHRNTPDIKGPRVEELPDSEGEEHVTTQQGGPRNADDDEDDAPGISLLDILRLIAVAFFTSCALSYMVTHNSFIWGYKAPWWTRPSVVARYFVCLRIEDPVFSHVLGTD